MSKNKMMPKLSEEQTFACLGYQRFVCMACGKKQILSLGNAEELGWLYGMKRDIEYNFVNDWYPYNAICFDCWQPNRINAQRLMEKIKIRNLEIEISNKENEFKRKIDVLKITLEGLKQDQDYIALIENSRREKDLSPEEVEKIQELNRIYDKG